MIIRCMCWSYVLENSTSLSETFTQCDANVCIHCMDDYMFTKSTGTQKAASVTYGIINTSCAPVWSN